MKFPTHRLIIKSIYRPGYRNPATICSCHSESAQLHSVSQLNQHHSFCLEFENLGMSLIVRSIILLVLFQFVSACTEELATPEAVDIAQALQKAKEGDWSAQYHLATIYHAGKGTAINQEKASYWYLKAAQQDVTMAQTRIGARLIEGEGIKKDVGAGIQWLQKAANKNDGLAQLVLASTYLGEFKSGLKNFEKAFYWMLKAAKTGVVPAQFEVSKMYVNGIGTEANYDQGIYWLQKAAEGGNLSAMNVLSGAYSKGLFGLQQDQKKADYWWGKSENVSNQKGE
ncbi:MAG: tetratricopeptide repeat protein [Desulfoprunum sp.]|nr:tetratricopeptide repeat protein [Desulfoprunum sp.]